MVSMRKFTRLIIAITAFALLFSMLCVNSLAAGTGSLSNFKKANTYVENQFSDVKSTDWFSGYVQKAYELGLMTGVSAGVFDPNANLTLASTIVIADRIHDIYCNMNTDFKSNGTGPWYQPYIDYAMNNGIISKESVADYNDTCSRGEFVFLIAKALPASEFPQKNLISAVPDVPAKYFAYSDIMLFYRAGVLAGNDIYGTFTPESSITRGSVAAILTRIIDVNSRLTTKLEIKAESIVVNSRKVAYPRLSIGESYTPPFMITPANSTEKADWLSSDSTVATVKDGVVTGVKEGVATIVATLPNGTQDRMIFAVESDITLANVGIRALKVAIATVPGVTADDLQIKSVVVGSLNVRASEPPQVVAYVTYSDRVTKNTNYLVVWHCSIDAVDGYYYDYVRTDRSKELQSKRTIDLGLLSY